MKRREEKFEDFDKDFREEWVGRLNRELGS